MFTEMDVGSIFSILGNYYTPEIQDDYEAIKSDWEVVGEDIGKVIGKGV